MKKKDETLRETLLDTARILTDTDGPDRLNIRSIAKKAGVASGTVYNYFSSKDEILLELTKEYWKQALCEIDAVITTDSFCEALPQIYNYLQDRISQSAGMLMNSLSRIPKTGQESMASAQLELKQVLIRQMDRDPGICSSIWTEEFSKEKLAEFIRISLMEALKPGNNGIDFLIIILNRILYK